jgi:phosphoglycolate phosphatase
VSGSDTLVLFDWNGTIVDDCPRARRALNRVLTPRGLDKLDEWAFTEAFRLPLDSMFRELGVAESQLRMAVDEWNRAMADREAPLRLGAIEALQGLKASGVLLGVVSTASSVALTADLKGLAMSSLFESITSGVADKRAELIRRRPDRRHAVYVGDTEYDIECARDAGFLAIGITGGYCPEDRLRAAGADDVVAELSDLQVLLLNRPTALTKRSIK